MGFDDIPGQVGDDNDFSVRLFDFVVDVHVNVYIVEGVR